MGFEMLFTLGFALLLGGFCIYKFICYKFYLPQVQSQTMANPYAFTGSCQEFERKIEELKQMLVMKISTVEDVGDDICVFDIIRISDQIIIDALKKMKSVLENEISVAEAAMGTLRNRQIQGILDNQALSRSEFVNQMKHVRTEIRPLLSIISQALVPKVHETPSSETVERREEDVDPQLHLIWTTLSGVDTQLLNIITQTEAEGNEGYQRQQPTHNWDCKKRRRVIKKLLNVLKPLM